MVGKTTDKHVEALLHDYTARTKHYLPFEVEIIPDLRNARSLSQTQQKQQEGQAILRCLRDGDWLVLLDEQGREFRSVEFAAHLEKRQASVSKRMVFVIGGAYGFSEEVYARAQEKISLSRMTFSHQMVRIFMVEQLYRAMTILKGEPYHHE